jgi:alpha-acetolactate decarboxylase
VLACELEQATIALDQARDFRMALPDDPAFNQADLTPDQSALDEAERGRSR